MSKGTDQDIVIQAALEIPLLHLRLAHHCTLLIGTFDPAIHQRHPLANAARTATEAMEELKNKLYEQAEAEYPGADWLQEYGKEKEITVWPPRITGQEADR